MRLLRLWLLVLILPAGAATLELKSIRGVEGYGLFVGLSALDRAPRPGPA